MIRFVNYWRIILCYFKAITAWFFFSLTGKKLTEKQIWLFEEKHTEARDNAYHLFSFVKKNHPEINAYYVIIKGSPDEKKICQFGSIVYAETLKHYLYWMAAKYSISSQPNGAAPNPREWVCKLKGLCRRDQKTVFLQHGIIKDNLPSLDYEKTRFDLFVCSAVPELMYVCEELHYPSSKAKLIGLCRFDNLNSFNTKKNILIMPTFRHWLRANDPDAEATEQELMRFRESEFFQHYFRLLTDKKLIKAAEENGYRIIFYMHYTLQSYVKSFDLCNNHIVKIADRHTFDVQQLLKDSDVLVTDYSSIFFDFAYMEKPEVFFQFDLERFRNRHYEAGYFDYRRDGFGPVFTQASEVTDYIVQLLENGCRNNSEYLSRIHAFFPRRDSENCKRTFKAILEIK